MQMEIFTMEIEKTTKPMEMGYISIWKERNMLGNGLKINSMDMARKHGQIQRNMKGTTKWGKSMGKGNSYGVMALHMKV